MQIRLIRYHLW